MKVIELALFKLKADVTEGQFLAALQDSNRWLANQPGFIQHRHGVGEEGRMDLVEWESMTAAKVAADQFMNAPETQAYMEVIDLETVSMRHFQIMS